MKTSDFYEDNDEDNDEDVEDKRECSSSCAHFDSLNQCCWLVTNRGLCTNVSEGDFCIHGFTRGGFE